MKAPATSATTMSSQISSTAQAAMARGTRVRARERRRAVGGGVPVVMPPVCLATGPGAVRG
ncbi:hypothetical protein EES39_37350 [Streptomyces sp. ADI92-24]|nr:hypothetical protein EES39_37350 [Streptomyces sp. ADI92-24]